MINKKIAACVLLALSGSALADSVSIDNPDTLQVTVDQYDGTTFYQGTDRDKYVGYKPTTPTTHVKAVNQGTGEVVFEKQLKSSVMLLNSMCNYSLFVTADEGYRLLLSESSHRNCTQPEDTFKEKIIYTFMNESDHAAYASFRKEGNVWMNDNFQQPMQPHETRSYYEDDGYWNHASVDIHAGTVLETGVYDPYLMKNVSCSEMTPVAGHKTFKYRKDNAGNYICEQTIAE